MQVRAQARGCFYLLADVADIGGYSCKDSNALILPCKRKNKAQGKAKDDKKDKNKGDPKMSKSKLKKLQKLEEEKQQKLLQTKSIEILRKLISPS